MVSLKKSGGHVLQKIVVGKYRSEYKWWLLHLKWKQVKRRDLSSKQIKMRWDGHQWTNMHCPFHEVVGVRVLAVTKILLSMWIDSWTDRLLHIVTNRLDRDHSSRRHSCPYRDYTACPNPLQVLPFGCNVSQHGQSVGSDEQQPALCCKEKWCGKVEAQCRPPLHRSGAVWWCIKAL